MEADKRGALKAHMRRASCEETGGREPRDKPKDGPGVQYTL